VSSLQKRLAHRGTHTASLARPWLVPRHSERSEAEESIEKYHCEAAEGGCGNLNFLLRYSIFFVV